MDFSADGDTTNLAARIERVAKPGSICVSGPTYELVKDFFEFEPLGKMQVKGKEAHQKVYELLRAGGLQTRIEVEAARGLTRFVGRRNSMGALRGALEMARAGSGQVVGVVGEAGVGKSRLLLEMRNLLPPGACTYLEGRCSRIGGSMAYLPTVDILRSFLGVKEGDPEPTINDKLKTRLVGLDERLQGALSPLQELLSLQVEDEAYLKLEPQQRRKRIFEALRDLLVRLSQEKPLVVAIEDLHWIDKTTEQLLDYLFGWIAEEKILIVLLYRPEYHHEWGSKSYYNRIGLKQLTPESSSHMVRAILDEAETDADLMALILGRAGGNPLFIEEFTRSLVETGSLERREGRLVLTREPASVPVPHSIRGVIASRIDRLEENLKRTIQAASVIGREFGFRILQAITGAEEELQTSLLGLQSMELIYQRGLFPELKYLFKHALTQEVAYSRLLLQRRKELHEEIGQAIEKIHVDKLEDFYQTLAHHYEKADQHERALHYLTEAANRARALYANEDAIGLYRKALEQVGRLREGREAGSDEWLQREIDLHEGLGDVLELTGRHEEARRIYQEALDRIPEKDAIGQSRLHRKLGRTWEVQSRHEIVAACYETADRLLGKEPGEEDRDWWREWLDVQLARLHLCYWRKRIPEMNDLAEKSQQAVDRYGTPAQRASYFTNLTLRDYLRERYLLSQETIDLCLKAVSASRETGNPASISLPQFMLGFSYLWSDQLDAALEALQDSLALTERIGDVVVQSRCLTYLTIVHRRRGEVETVRGYIPRCVEVATAAQMSEYVGTAMANEAWVAWCDQDLSKTVARGVAAMDLWGKLPEGHASCAFKWTALWPLIAVALASRGWRMPWNMAGPCFILPKSAFRTHSRRCW
jgi:tetratricopeptide (TPR) repeat protein